MAKNSNGSEPFLTDRYKRFLNSNSVLFVFVEELFWAILAFVGILPTSWLTWFFARSFNKLIATPIWQIFASINNLRNERKQFKSIIMLITLSLSMIIGGLLGYFVLYQSPLFMGAVTTFLNQISCPPAISFFGAMFGGIIATLFGKIPPFIGVSVGTFIGSYLPLTIPLIVDVVFVSSLTTAVFAGYIAKKLLRAYYQTHYGYANADGYKTDCSPAEQEEYIAHQAKKFNVEPLKFKELITHCKNQIKKIKSRASFFEEYWEIRRAKTNTYKDIFHKLMDPKLEQEDIDEARELLRLSTTSKVKEDTEALSSISKKELKYLPSFFTSIHLNKTGNEVRVLTHQLFLEGGIDDEMIQPFLQQVN